MQVSSESTRKKVEDLVGILKPLSESYRLLVGSAEEFNRITLAHKNDLVDAIHRADDLGNLIDHLLRTLDCVMRDWLHEIKNNPGPSPALPDQHLEAMMNTKTAAKPKT